MESKYLNKKYISILLHVCCLGLIFLWPLMQLDDIVNQRDIAIKISLPTVCIVILFYLNYLALIDFFYFKNKRPLFFIINLGLLFIFYFSIKWLNTYMTAGFPPFNSRPHMRHDIPHIQLFISLVFSVGMSIAFKISINWKKRELEIEKIKQSQLYSEVKALRHQIQPHFLFNTLNNIYSLVDISPEIAKTSIHSLSNMMRYLLFESTTERIPLIKEILFLERYIALMQLRVSSNLTIRKNFPVINQPIQIAPLLLISFIENSFKHGIDALQESFININITINDNEINYTVVNSFFPDKVAITNSGIGLENLKKRLELLYPNKFSLNLEENVSTYTAQLILNFE